jgi:hypothetical protein
MSETESFSKRRDSFVAGVSVRGTVTLAVTITVCAMQFLHLEVGEPLKTIAVVIFGYYFLNRDNPPAK